MGIGGRSAGRATGGVTLQLRSGHKTDFNITISAVILRNLTNALPEFGSDMHLNGLTLADPTFAVPGPIDLLLGADVLSEVLLEGIRKGQLGQPIAQQTEFGWIVSGATLPARRIPNSITGLVVRADIDGILTNLWELNELPEHETCTGAEDYCEGLYRETTTRTSDGRYMVKLPRTPGFTGNGSSYVVSNGKKILKKPRFWTAVWSFY